MKLTDLRRQLTARRLAQASIVLELVVVGRTLGEIYRLHADPEAALTLDAVMVWLTGALIALGFLAVAVLLYFAGRDRLVTGTAGLMVVVLIVYKLLEIGPG